jgi:formylmethanofuran dehydrogenase subunit C
MAINNKPASAYAKPHTMSGKSITTAKDSVTKPGNGLDKANISVAGVSKGNYAPTNKNGEITMRGAGAATKGTKCRGPMA